MKPDEQSSSHAGIGSAPALATYTRCPEHLKQLLSDVSAASVPKQQMENNSTLSSKAVPFAITIETARNEDILISDDCNIGRLADSPLSRGEETNDLGRKSRQTSNG
jgi:hypothetical protein